MSKEQSTFGPWNPGINSQIPRDILPLSSMFRPENARTSLEQAHEYADLTGLTPFECVEFRPERLAAHEVLIRVTADLSVPDGPEYADLGINMRGMVETIYNAYILPEMEQIASLHEAFREGVVELATAELTAHVFNHQSGNKPEQNISKKGFLKWFSSSKEKPQRQPRTPSELATDALNAWRKRAETSTSESEKSTLQGLIKIVGAILGNRGRLIADVAVIAELVAGQVSNTLGSEELGKSIDPVFTKAAAAEEYVPLPAQEKPLVMNIKGASASGKSTMRNAQHALADRLGIPWGEFALISPDYWRKYLLDYERLGDDFKYAGALSGHELAIVDKKLDRYMAEKANRGLMSHLLIDRFRFDSFSSRQDRAGDSTLLSRFGDTIYLFFMVTPPEATVERAWLRGLKTGRYKAVDDLLFHNIEAFTGMPQLFLSWALSANKKVHYEFLDNSVKEGEIPRTIAFGRNGDMTILDVKSMLNIERFKHININADTPGDVYEDDANISENATRFLTQCVEHIPNITLAHFDNCKPYAQVQNGACVWSDKNFKTDGMSKDLQTAYKKLGVSSCSEHNKNASPHLDYEKEKQLTLGAWGTSD